MDWSPGAQRVPREAGPYSMEDQIGPQGPRKCRSRSTMKAIPTEVLYGEQWRGRPVLGREGARGG